MFVFFFSLSLLLLGAVRGWRAVSPGQMFYTWGEPSRSCRIKEARSCFGFTRQNKTQRKQKECNDVKSGPFPCCQHLTVTTRWWSCHTATVFTTTALNAVIVVFVFSCSYIRTFGSFRRWRLWLFIIFTFILFKTINVIYNHSSQRNKLRSLQFLKNIQICFNYWLFLSFSC